MSAREMSAMLGAELCGVVDVDIRGDVVFSRFSKV